MVNRTNIPWVNYLRQNRFAFLLLGLFVLYFYGAVIEILAPRMHSIAIRITVGMILGYMIIAATLVVGVFDGSLKLVLFLAVPAFVFEVVDVVVLKDSTQILSHGFGIAFIGYIVYRLLVQIFTDEEVTADTIFASLCVYLLLATIWTYSYSLLEMFDPGAFSYPLLDELIDAGKIGNGEAAGFAQPDDGTPRRVMRLGAEPAGIESYYSLVTMTTLGYGDIVPTSSAARSLATMQAVIGQLYLTVLVARLVGLHVAGSTKRDK